MGGKNYCTYFDHRYLPRGLTMIESIRKFDPKAVFYVLALDEPCFNILSNLGDASVKSVKLHDLEKYDTDLAQKKGTRSEIEYYFTLTPCFPLFVMKYLAPEIDLLTYVDSDTFFFADPEIIFQEIGLSSIAITPHRFSPERAHLERYGRFNVGWISWRNNSEGLQCLEDYRDDCLEWCFDRIEGDRFGDQKYLDKWPNKYSSLHQIEHVGVNAATWNINRYAISEIDEVIFLNDSRLVFWHYHGLKERPDGLWIHNVDEAMQARNPRLLDLIYTPYIRQLREKDAFLQKNFGLTRDLSRHIRYDQSPPGTKAPPLAPSFKGWRKIGLSWPQERPTGWNHQEIADVRRSQWKTLSETLTMNLLGNSLLEQTNNLVVLDALDEALCRRPGRGPLRVLDWGGEIGMLHHRLKHLRPAVNIEYTVKEVGFLCDLGREINPQVNFVDNDEDAISKSYDLIIASASLHYSNNWRNHLISLCDRAEGVLLLARQPLVKKGPSFVFQQAAYGTAFTGWVISEQDLLTTFRQAGVGILRNCISGDNAHIEGAEEQPVFRSFLLKKKP